MPGQRASDRARKVWWAHAMVAGVLFGAVVLVVWPPGRYGFYPACPVREMSGVLCPGCGGTRAVAALLRGNLGEALRQNGLVVVLLPAAVWPAGRWYLGVLRGMEAVGVPRWAVVSVGVLAGLFGLLRNVG